MARYTRTAALTPLLVAGLAIQGSACARQVHMPTLDARPAVDAIFAKYAASLGAGDADTWANLWREDGVQLPPDEPPVVGKPAIREKLRGVLTQFRFDMHINTEEVRTAGDMAFARGRYSATLIPRTGGAPIPIDGKFLTILTRQADGQWLIYRDIFNSNVPPRGR